MERGEEPADLRMHTELALTRRCWIGGEYVEALATRRTQQVLDVGQLTDPMGAN